MTLRGCFSSLRRSFAAFATIASSVVVTATVNFSAEQAAEALRDLDNAIARRGEFIESRQHSIDSLLSHISKTTQPSTVLILDIAKRYTAFNNDSALYYLQWGANVAPPHEAVEFKLRMASLMPLDGAIKEALDVYQSVDSALLDSVFLPLYYESGRQMYSYIADTHSISHDEKVAFEKLALEREHRLMEVADPNDSIFSYLVGEYSFERGETQKARALLTHVLENTPVSSNLRARAAHHLSAIAREEGDMNSYLYFLAQSALADVTAATREVAALQELGYYLYTCNDVDRAYNYLTTALASAVECGASMRVIESSQMLPLIEQAKAAQISSRERFIKITMVMLAILLLATLVVATLLFRRIKGMRRLENQLRETNRTREGYIARFLDLCSIYMDKMNQLCKLTERKITAGKVDELLKLAKSGKFVEDQSKEFYEIFDNAVLHLYPDFTEKVNSLLLPDKQISQPDEGCLNTELRILAIIRMGISDSSKIAQVLNFSINTIYSYRNRIKARAIDRENFEDSVRNLR